MLKDFNGYKPKIHLSSFIFENTTIIGRVMLYRNVSIWPGTVLRADVAEIIVGRDSNLQDGVLVHTNYELPVIIGRGTTVGHGAILHGCRVGNNCLIGMGAIILDGAVIADNSIIGAGAVVTENSRFASGSLVLGVPGRLKRKVTKEEIQKNRESAKEYLKLSGLHFIKKEKNKL